MWRSFVPAVALNPDLSDLPGGAELQKLTNGIGGGRWPSPSLAW